MKRKIDEEEMKFIEMKEQEDMISQRLDTFISQATHPCLFKDEDRILIVLKMLLLLF